MQHQKSVTGKSANITRHQKTTFVSQQPVILHLNQTAWKFLTGSTDISFHQNLLSFTCIYKHCSELCSHFSLVLQNDCIKLLRHCNLSILLINTFETFLRQHKYNTVSKKYSKHRFNIVGIATNSKFNDLYYQPGSNS